VNIQEKYQTTNRSEFIGYMPMVSKHVKLYISIFQWVNTSEIVSVLCACCIKMGTKLLLNNSFVSPCS